MFDLEVIKVTWCQIQTPKAPKNDRLEPQWYYSEADPEQSSQ